MPAPQRFMEATCPGVARPVRSPNPKLGAKPSATHFLVIDFLSDAADTPVGAAIGFWERFCLYVGRLADPRIGLSILFVLAAVLIRQSGCYFNDCFDNTGFRLGVGFEVCQHAFKTGAMSDPRISVDGPVLNQADDACEIWW